MEGLYGRAYGTLTANVENLTPAAQGGGLQPLQPSRWTGTSTYATVATANTPPAVASPTVPYPGHPSYGLQQGPTYAPITGYGSADYEVGYRGALDYLKSFFTDSTATPVPASSASTLSAPMTYIGAGGWSYAYNLDAHTFVASHPDGRILDLAPGIRGYKAVVEEAMKIVVEKVPKGDARTRVLGSLQSALYKANSTPETRSPVNRGTAPAAPAPSAAPLPPAPAPGDVPPKPGLSTEVKVALGVLAASVVVGGAIVVLRRRRRA